MLKKSLRHLWREPALSFLAVVSIGLGLAANLVGYLLVERSQAYSLPFRATDELVAIWRIYEWDPNGWFPFPEFLELSRP